MHEFQLSWEYYQLIPGTDEYRFNYWGYSTCATLRRCRGTAQPQRKASPGAPWSPSSAPW
eukprot:jgi/Botrbrau1/2796/Bobra.0125s0008.1